MAADYVYSGDQNDEVQKIDSTGANVWDYTGHTDQVLGVAVDADGNVYSGSADDEVHKITSAGANTWEYTGHTNNVNGVAVDAGGNVYSASSDNEVHKISSAGSNTWEYTGHTSAANCVDVDADGNVYSGAWDDEVHKITSGGSNTWEYTGHSGAVYGVDVDYQGYVYSASLDDDVHKINSAGGNEWTYTGFSDDVQGVAADKDGYVYAGGWSDQLQKIDSSGSQVWYKNEPGNIAGVAVDNDGYSYIADRSHYVRQYDSDGNGGWDYNQLVDVLAVAVYYQWPTEHTVDVSLPVALGVETDRIFDQESALPTAVVFEVVATGDSQVASSHGAVVGMDASSSRESEHALSFGAAHTFTAEGYREIPAAISVASELGITVTALNWTQWLEENKAQAIPRYYLTLTGSVDGETDLEIPIESFQGRLRSGDPSYLRVVIRDVTTYQAGIAARSNGDLKLEMAYEIAGTESQREALVTVDLSEIRTDYGPRRKSITLTGYRTSTPATKTTYLSDVTYRSLDDGSLHLRTAVPDLYLQPGDTARYVSDDYDDSFTVDSVTYIVSASRQQMDVMEA